MPPGCGPHPEPASLRALVPSPRLMDRTRSFPAIRKEATLSSRVENSELLLEKETFSAVETKYLSKRAPDACFRNCRLCPVAGEHTPAAAPDATAIIKAFPERANMASGEDILTWP